MNSPYHMNTRTTRQWQQTDAEHHLHPFTDTQALAAKGARVIARGDGIHIEDNDGKRYLDAMSGLWCVNLGYGQQPLIEAATRQLNELAYYNCFFQTTTPPAAELAELLASVAPPGFKHVFFANSGSESNDTNIRLVRRYWDLMGQPQRRVIISRKNAYHGSTIAAGSLGGMAYMHDQGGVIPDIEHIQQPYWFEHDRSISKAEFGMVAAGWLEEKILEVGPDKVAAFIGEPIQGAGGVIIPPETYWPEIQRICDKYGILLISDEVICGFGRTGRMWGCQSMGTRPDLITFAKGVTSGYVPLGGVMVGERVAKVLIEKGGDFNHGYTYSGHPVACAVAIANLRLLQELDVVRTVREELAPRLARHFSDLQDHPLVGSAETFGMMGGIHLVKDKASNTPFPAEQEIGMLCRGICFDNGLVMRAVGDRMVIAPPLIMTPPQMDVMTALIHRCLDLTHEQAVANGWMK
jgi:putrescine aminotransferase